MMDLLDRQVKGVHSFGGRLIAVEHIASVARQTKPEERGRGAVYAAWCSCEWRDGPFPGQAEALAARDAHMQRAGAVPADAIMRTDA